MSRFVVFGAAGHIGGPCARTLAAEAGAGAVRVCSHRPEGVEALRQAFPGSEAVRADMTSPDDMARVLDGADAVFVVTPDFFDDLAGARALIAAAERLGTRPHVVRVQAEVPGLAKEALSGMLADPIGRRGHIEAREAIEAAGLPATFLNVLGYYMDDLTIRFGEGLREHDTLLVPYDRPMCWLDPADLGEAAARVMLGGAPDAARMLHLNDGADGVRFSTLAGMIGEARGRPVAYADDEDAFRQAVGPMLAAMTGRADAGEYLLADWRSERDHAHAYVGTRALAGLLGRAPTTLQAWLQDNAAALSG